MECNFEVREGDERVLPEPDVAKLPYLRAVVKELFRLYPPYAVSFPTSLNAAIHHMLGFELPLRTQVVMLGLDAAMQQANPLFSLKFKLHIGEILSTVPTIVRRFQLEKSSI